jgi:AraC family transcriptional regulator of arabinose operon
MGVSKFQIVKEVVPLEVPQYLHILTGHYFVRGSGYYTKRLRGTEDWLLIITLSGMGRFGTSSQQLLVQERDCVLIRPGTGHDYGMAQKEGGWELLWAHFHPRPHWHDWLAWPEHTPGLMHLTLVDDLGWKEVRTCFRRTHLAAIGAESHSQDLAMNGLESLLLCCQGALLQSQSPVDERIQHILHWLNGRLADPLDVASLASAVALSPSRFAHLFREQIGTSPMQYLDLLRMQRSKQLLERTTNSIAQIADEVGLDAVYFSLRFKQHTGLSPRAYRAQKRTEYTAATCR